jgi:hypothetical protein
LLQAGADGVGVAVGTGRPGGVEHLAPQSSQAQDRDHVTGMRCGQCPRDGCRSVEDQLHSGRIPGCTGQLAQAQDPVIPRSAARGQDQVIAQVR